VICFDSRTNIHSYYHIFAEFVLGRRAAGNIRQKIKLYLAIIFYAFPPPASAHEISRTTSWLTSAVSPGPPKRNFLGAMAKAVSFCDCF